MDKQFARILMLSALLPAGVALAEAIQREHISFDTIDQAVIANLTGKPREVTSRENRMPKMAGAALEQHAQHVVNRGAGGSDNLGKLDAAGKQ
jgi:hypothetical protein